MHENRDDLDDKWRQDVALTLEESLSGVKKCKTINGGQKLKQVIADDHCSFIVNVFEKKNESLWNVKQRRYGYCTDEKVDNKRPLVKDSNFLWFVFLSADFIGQTCIETDNDQVAKGEWEKSGDTHSHEKNLLSPTPPKVDQNNGIVQQFAYDTWQEMTDNFVVGTGGLLLELVWKWLHGYFRCGFVYNVCLCLVKMI